MGVHQGYTKKPYIRGTCIWLTSRVLEDYPELEVRYCVFPSGISTLISLQLEKLHNL